MRGDADADAIVADLRTAAVGTWSRERILQTPEIVEWLRQHGLSPDDLHR